MAVMGPFFDLRCNYSGTPSLPSPLKGEGREGAEAQREMNENI